ncbi:hypothetical protein [Clostridium butyricum]
MKRLIKPMYVFQIFAYLMSYYNDKFIPLSLALFINLYFFVLYVFIVKKSIILNRRIYSIVLSFIFIFIIYGICFCGNEVRILTYINITKMFIFIINIVVTSMVIYEEHEEEFFLKSTFYTIGLFVVFCYIIHFDNFAGLTSLGSIFNRELRYRESFGIYHPNAMGSLCLINLILFKMIKIKSKEKVLVGFICVVNIIVLLSTSSRSSITSLCIFYLGILLLNIERKIKIDMKLKVIFKAVRILIIATIILIIFNDININYLFNESNRLTNFTVNIPELIKNNKLLTGFGLINPGLYFQSAIPYKTTYVDNCFLYIFLSWGLIGSRMITIALVNFSYIIFKSKKITAISKSNVVMIFFIHIYSSLFETCFLIPELIISYVFFIIYFLFIFEQGKNNLNGGESY